MTRPSRLRRYLIILGALAILFTVVGFFALPPIVKSQLEKRASEILGRRVTVEKVRINPYALSLTLENFAIRDRDGTSPFLGWKNLYVNFDAISSFAGEWVLSDIALDGFDARVGINPDQSLTVADIIAKLAPPAGATPPPPAKSEPARPIRIASLKVNEARIAFSDQARPKPFATTLGPLTFAITEFRTLSERGAPYRFEAVTESGEKLAWTGTLNAEPPRSAGEFRLENILLPKYAAYYASQLQGELTSGQLSVRGRYEIDLTQDKQVIRLHEGSVQLRSFALRERGQTGSAVELPSLDVTGIEADALAQKATVASVALRGGNIRARREKDGTINLLAMVTPPAAPGAATPAATPPATPPAPAKQPDVMIADVSLQEFQINVSDLAAPRPAQLTLDRLEVALKNVTLAPGAEIPVRVAFAWAPQGTVNVDGKVVLSPLKADLKTDIAGFHLLPLSPYLEEFVNARLTQGTLTASLSTQLALPEGQPPQATASGDISLEKLGLVDAAKNEDLAGFGALQLRGLRASSGATLSLALDEINLAAPYARVVVHPDQTLNVATIARTAPAAASTASTTPAAEAPPTVALPSPPAATSTTPAPAATAPQITVGKIVIRDGDYRFTDRSITPNVALALNQFGGTISGLSSANLAKADVALKATVDGSGPIAINGKLDVLGPKPSVDLKVDFANIDLLPLSPYSGKFAGYELARGKLLLDIKLLVDGKKIDSANVLTLNQFTFGAPVQSPEATKLPVRLGVALLKDLDGKIVIDIPVQGSTDDPNFRIGRVVWRVIGNLLTKAATSPFSLLGAAFGGGSEELAFQDFAPGSTEIQATELKKLQTMVQALTNRPGLNLDLRGSFDAAADAYALKRVKLADQVRRAVWEEKRRADPNVPPPEQLAITPEENAAMIKQLYDEKFPPGTEFGAPVPPPPQPVAPPPEPAGWFKRIVRTITREGKREAAATVAENERRQAEHAKAVESAVATGRPLDEMRERLAEAVTVDDNDLRALAQARAQQIRTYFTDTGKIAPERLFLAKEQDAAAPTTTAANTKGARVFLSLQ